MRHGGRFGLAGVAALLGLAGVLVPAAPSGAQVLPGPALLPLSSAAAPRLPRAAADLGAVAARKEIRLEVALKVPDPQALSAFIAGLSDRSSPLFGHFLRRGQFGARFGPSLAEVAAVRNALRAQGLSPGPVTADRLAIPVSGTAAVIEKAFGTALASYRLPGGRVVYANSAVPRIAAAAAPYIGGVVGLNDVDLPRSQVRWPRAGRPAGQRRIADGPQQDGRIAAVSSAAGPQPCTAASKAAKGLASHTANQLASYYNMTPLYRLGANGQGVHVALAEFEPDSPADVSAYESCYRVHPVIRYVHVDGGAGSGSGSGEAALDIEDVTGLAPGAAVDVYQAPNGGDTDVLDLYRTIIKADTDRVISTSWGMCELDSDASLISAESGLFAVAATQGQTVFAAAGDSGSTDCLGDGSPNGAALAVDDPASQPYVVGVGGTTIGATSESVWNDSAEQEGATGGGLSSAWCMPGYQDRPAIRGLISGYSAKNAKKCGASVPYLRQVPDVAADADPATGYLIRYAGTWMDIGGTSGAAPLWAAVAALVDTSPFCASYGSGQAGVRPQGLYSVASAEHSYIYAAHREALRDVGHGNNDYTPSGYKGGRYPAASGYDLASGLGTPQVGGLTAAGKSSTFYPGLAALMCWEYRTKLGATHVTGVSPRVGPAARSRQVTVTGSGFLPIAGADRAQAGSVWVAARCTSTTRCTVVLPRTRPKTISIRISAEDLAVSPVTAAGRYRFVAAPKVSSLSPAAGRAAGGNKVTIHGRDFIGVSAVHFGGKRATSLRVISATEITVIAPSGSGTVNVTVTAAGGTSAKAAADHYRY